MGGVLAVFGAKQEAALHILSRLGHVWARPQHSINSAHSRTAAHFNRRLGGVNTRLSPTGINFFIMVSILSLYLFPSTLGVFLHLTAWASRWWFPALRGMKPVRISDSLNLWLFLTQAKAVVKSACPIGGWGLSTLMLFIKGLNTLLYISPSLFTILKNSERLSPRWKYYWKLTPH